MEIPQPIAEDPEAVVTALETAAVFGAQGDAQEALRWVRRAAEAASDDGNDLRALALARTAADLSSELQQASNPPQAATEEAPSPESAEATPQQDEEESPPESSAEAPAAAAPEPPAPAAFEPPPPPPPPRPKARPLSTVAKPVAASVPPELPAAQETPSEEARAPEAQVDAAEAAPASDDTPPDEPTVSTRASNAPPSVSTRLGPPPKTPGGSSKARPDAAPPSAGPSAAAQTAESAKAEAAKAEAAKADASQVVVRPTASIRLNGAAHEAPHRPGLRQAVRVSIAPYPDAPGFFVVRPLEDHQVPGQGAREALVVLLDAGGDLYAPQGE